MVALCILAAGLGTRNTFRGGAVHKALLPVGTKPVLSHIIDNRGEIGRIVVALGHRGDQIRSFLSVAYPDLDIHFVHVDKWTGDGAGPGYSLSQCRDVLDEPFVFSACDTLVKAALPAPDRNWIGVCAVDDPERWCTVWVDGGLARDLCYKSAEGTKTAFIGVAGVADPDRFFEALAQDAGSGKEWQVDAGLRGLMADSLAAIPLPWADVGSDESYARALEDFPDSLTFPGKATDLTFKVGDAIVKFFPDEAIARKRFERGRNNPDVFAQVLHSMGQFYSYRYIPGAPQSEFLGAGEVEGVLSWARKYLWHAVDMERSVFASACETFYLSKTRDRLDTLMERWAGCHIVESSEIIVNETIVPTVRDLLSGIPVTFWSDCEPSTYHGDFHPDNIIRGENEKFRLIDWRHEFGGLRDVGDMYYDLSKYYHALDFSVECMRDEKFFVKEVGVLSFEIKHYVKQEYKEAQKEFRMTSDHFGYNLNRIDVLNGLIFVNMAPLYEGNLMRYLYFLGRVRLANAIARAQ